MLSNNQTSTFKKDGYTATLMPKMLSTKQPGDPVFKEGDEQIVMANPVWLFPFAKKDEFVSPFSVWAK